MSSNNGQILYDRDANPGQVPAGSNASREIPHDGSEPSPTHVTQWYPDNTRVSWNAQNDGSRTEMHKTDQNKAKGSKNRHSW